MKIDIDQNITSFSSDKTLSRVYNSSCPAKVSRYDSLFKYELICDLSTITESNCNYRCDSIAVDYRVNCKKN